VFQFFESEALNFTTYFVLIMVIPLVLMGHTALTTKTPTRKKLLTSGGLLVLLCVLIASLLLSLLDTVGESENSYQSCQINYIYNKLSNTGDNQEEPIKCEKYDPKSTNELTDFKMFLVIVILIVNVVLLSFGINLISAASSMSNERICQDNLHNQIDIMNTEISKFLEKIRALKIFVGVFFIFIMLLVIYMFNT